MWQVDPTKTFDQVVTMEDLSKGQLITGYSIEAHKGGEWKRLKLVGGHGVTVGARVVDWGLGSMSGVTALRWNCTKALTQDPVTIARFAAYLGSTTTPGHNSETQPPEDDGCEVTLKKKLSATACVLGKTFGCNASASGGATIWTKGCRGIFSCDGAVIHAE